jgi:hypothetical protein
MNHLDVALAARAFRDGRAIRKALFRHRRLVDNPLAIVVWQLGAEPFSAAALGFGNRYDNLHLVVAGEPRNRDLAFSAMLKFAKWFNPLFEKPASTREDVAQGNRAIRIACTFPQVLVANDATVAMLGRIGRRLAYLSVTGNQPAPPELVRLGQHLQFISWHAGIPGQQLIVSLTELLNDHWVTPMSGLEKASLTALDAFIDPPNGKHGFHAAASREGLVVGPQPQGEDDARLEPLMTDFSRRRNGKTDPSIVTPLLRKIEAHYRPLVERTWTLLWRCRDREARVAEAPSVSRRVDLDRKEYTEHIDWTEQDGRRRTRQTSRQAAMLLRRLEEALSLLEAEEAGDDALRMVPYLLDGKAVLGVVVEVDADHSEMGPKQRVRRPLVTILSGDECLMPVGKELWWTRAQKGRAFEVHKVTPYKGGSLVTLKLTTSSKVPMPKIGETACFSVHNTDSQWLPSLPTTPPWTHRSETPSDLVHPIEEVEL